MCARLKQSDNDSNGLYSGHFTTCFLLNLFSLVNLFALCIHDVGVCRFPVPKSCVKGRLCVSCALLQLGWSIFFFKRYELFSLRGGGWYWFCASERYSLTDWPNNPSWIGEQIIFIPLILHRFLWIFISANELCISKCSEQRVRSGTAYLNLNILQVSPCFSRFLCMWDLRSRRIQRIRFALVYGQHWLCLTVTTGNSMEEIIVLDQSLKHRKSRCHRKGKKLTFHFL